MTSTRPCIVRVLNNHIIPINCLHVQTTNIGHAAGTQILANKVGPGAVGHNNNSGAGAGGFNSGDYSGSINNCRNCEGDRVAASVLHGGGSSQRVRRRRGEYFSRKFRGSYHENRPWRSFNRDRVSSTHTEERKCRYLKGSGRIRRLWIPKQIADERDKIFEFKTEKEEKDWLDSCAVGCLREPKDILPTVNENLREQGFTFCKAIHMGGDLVLLHCPNNNDLNTLIDKGRVLLKRHFQWVKPWSPKIGDERYVYLRIKGVPLHAWTERFFRMVVDRMRGRIISMDDATINKRRLGVATVLIRTTSNEIISESLTCRIDSNDYNVKVIEETDQNSAAVDPNWDISDNDGAVVDGRLDVEQSDGDSSDKGFKEIVGREEEISTGNSRSEFSRNTECNFQTAQQKCSSESGKNHNELGSQNVVSTKRLNARAKPFSPEEKLNAKAKPSGPANLSSPLICNGKEVSDKDSAVVNGRSEGELPEKGLCKGDEKERREEKIFHRNRKSEFIQIAQKTCSLSSKQDGCREEDGEIGSNDKGFQEIVGREEEIFTGNSRSDFSGNTECNFQTTQQKCSSESHKNQNELGSQDVIPTNTLNAGSKPFSTEERLNAKAKPSGPVNLSFPLICNGKEVSDKDSTVVNGRSEGKLSDGGLCKGDEMERIEEKIFTRNRKSEFIQTAQKTCSLSSKHDGCREEDREIGSRDKGSQQIIKSGATNPGGSGSKIVVQIRQGSLKRQKSMVNPPPY